MLRTSGIERAVRNRVLGPLARSLAARGWRARHLSLAAIFLGLLSGVLFVFDPARGGALYILSGLLDIVDGEVARRSKTADDAGAFLDSVLDRYTDFIVLLGILLYYHRRGTLDLTGTVVITALVFGSLMENYIQMRAESRGSSAAAGFWERPERLLAIGLAGILHDGLPEFETLSGLSSFYSESGLLGIVLTIVAAGTIWMTVRRILHGYMNLRG